MTLLLESIRTPTFLSSSLLFFWQNCTGYRIYRTCSKVASFLVLVIEAEVVNTDTSFLRYPGFFKVWISFSQNAPSYYSCNKWPRLHLFDLCYCVSCRSLSCIETGSQGARILPSPCLVFVYLLLYSSFFVWDFAGRQRVWWF